ncbi:MAG: helix-turn-helix transcriptional regulator [Chlamydiales bacterium]|nr:helix-turn-helix transcriptional regulator [Chlamydiales bacterium]
MKIDEWLMKNKMTLTEFCKRLDVKRSYFVRILQGSQQPTRILAFKIEEVTEGAISALKFFKDPTNMLNISAEDL